ncbi:hypothetical protein E0Z10_g7377 [Xylaria hypoxylon]|uniref:DNA mismatch repair protein HSM3 N-terminal domain-containing protein n=1 Tax=Xylaria hypoxylon TaxID=37992 RepID=A0A4Z0YSG1_9PEZI|nr:hypothetical protein E0Z10_g7377 [Xylaria hypoxylon]
MDTIDSLFMSRIDQLEQHLDELANDPTQPTGNPLFDLVGLEVTGTHNIPSPYANIIPLIPRLLPKITDILRRYQLDPLALCNLAIRLVRPLDFHEAMAYAPQDALIEALRSPAPSANLLAMTILAKAARSPTDAAVLATMKEVVTSFVTRWLSAPEVEVGEKATQVLGDLLMIDSTDWPIEGPGESPHEPASATPNVRGQGFMWRRIFFDREVYGLILSLCSKGSHQNAEGGLNTYRLSLAQSRLLRLLPRIAVYDLAIVTRTTFPDLHRQYMNSDAPGGLLYFAALHMADTHDFLMSSLLIDFVQRFFSTQVATPNSAFKMDTLRNIYQALIRNDVQFENVLLTLPDHIIPEEADELRQFIHDITTN